MKRLAILVSYSGAGGVERVVNLLSSELARYVGVDIVAIKFRGPHADHLPANVRLVRLRAQHAATAIGEVAAYVARERPDVLLAAKDRAARTAVQACRRAGTATRVWLQIHSNMSQSLAQRSAPERWLRRRAMHRLYPLADGIVAVSAGVRDDLVNRFGLDPKRVHIVHNPAIPADLTQRAAEPIPHPWLADKPCPVVMGMGRLTAQKDFTTLVRAFALLQVHAPTRLIVLGDGRNRAELERLVASLRIEDRVHFAGYQENPYAWLAHADLFVLSSRWEGFGNALAEALALGVPSVATDCPSGPREILAGGRYGPLVPVGDAGAMAEAMRATLHSPLPPGTLCAAVDEYRAESSARRYLQLLGLLA